MKEFTPLFESGFRKYKKMMKESAETIDLPMLVNDPEAAEILEDVIDYIQNDLNITLDTEPTPRQVGFACSYISEKTKNSNPSVREKFTAICKSGAEGIKSLLQNANN